MEWTFDHFKHNHREQLQKAEKHRMSEDAKQESTPLRRGVLGKRRANHSA